MTFHLLLAATTATTTSASSKKTGGSYGFLIIILILVAFYFLIIRPRSQRQRQARAQASAVGIGDRVMTVGGIKGTVVDMDDTDVHVEVAPGVVLTFIRRAVNAAPAGDAPAAGDDAPGTFPPDDGPEGPAGPPGDHGSPGDDLGHDYPDDRPGTGTEGR